MLQSEVKDYDDLIAKEASFWGGVNPRSDTPQIWHDGVLNEMFFGNERRNLQRKVVQLGGRSLDLGCGEGALTIYFAKKKVQAEGIDVSPDRIDRARQAARRELGNRTNNASLRSGDLNVMELPVSTYDSITAWGSLHHILRLDFALDQIRKALKPDGVFLVYDYIGMGAIRKILAAFLYALLPTYKSYWAKLKLARRLTRFLASEQRRRKQLALGKTGPLHEESPFEEISQHSIIGEIQKRFHLVHLSTHLPFFFYCAAKVKIPRRWKYSFARRLKVWDDMLVRHNVSTGAYAFIIAKKRIDMTMLNHSKLERAAE